MPHGSRCLATGAIALTGLLTTATPALARGHFSSMHTHGIGGWGVSLGILVLGALVYYLKWKTSRG